MSSWFVLAKHFEGYAGIFEKYGTLKMLSISVYIPKLNPLFSLALETFMFEYKFT